jgi:hypothetical protein
MIESDPASDRPTPASQEDIDTIVSAGPHGALSLAGIATAIVVAIWFMFYFFVFIPRA